MSSPPTSTRLLVVDFAQFSADATLADTLRRELPEATIERVDAVSDFGADFATMGVAEIAAVCAERLADSGRVPDVLIGYCSASTLALGIRAALRERAADPVTVLVEPTWVTDETIAGDLVSVRESLDADGRPTAVRSLTGITATLEEDLARQLRASGMPDDEIALCASMLVSRYAAWFGFLIATRDSPTPDPEPSVTLIAVSDEAATTPAGWPSSCVTVRRLPASAGHVLSNPHTVEVIRAVIREVRR